MEYGYEQDCNKDHGNYGRPGHVPVRGFHLIGLERRSPRKTRLDVREFPLGGFNGPAHHLEGFAYDVHASEILIRQKTHDQQLAGRGKEIAAPGLRQIKYGPVWRFFQQNFIHILEKILQHIEGLSHHCRIHIRGTPFFPVRFA